MSLKLKVLGGLLSVLLFVGAPMPTFGLGMMKGGGGGGSPPIAEILAAGLIARLLMDNKPSPMPTMLHAIKYSLMGGYGGMHSRHAMYPMMSAKYPMMGSFAYPVMRRPRFHMMNHAMMAHAASNHHQVLTSRLNEQIKALEAQESMLEAALVRARQNVNPQIGEMFSEDETSIPAAALLMETADFVGPPAGLENRPMLPPPEMFHAAASQPESRYILPRIVRHFVQRILKRGENH